jgi:hypothetical protein
VLKKFEASKKEHKTEGNKWAEEREEDGEERGTNEWKARR